MDKRDLWKTTLDELEINLTKANFQTWFPLTFINKIEPKEGNRQVIEIATSSPFVAENIENRYYNQIKEILDKRTDKKNELIFTVKRIRPAAAGKKTKLGPLFEKKKIRRMTDQSVKDLGLRPDFTFANFAVSSSNQTAYAAATAVAKTPGKAYNPLFLYGGVGVGKTHLMQAIAHQIITANPQSRLIYCSSEEFTNDFIEALRTKRANEFKKRYRKVKALLIDDVQFFGGKEKVQEELFHTFNAIYRNGQVVLTSDRQPREIEGLEDRLRSRFEGGLTIDIQAPDFELRCAILLIKAKQQNLNLPMDVAKLIASNIEDTRRLEGFLTRLITEAHLKDEAITPEFANALLGKVSEPREKRIVRPKEVLDVVANHYDLKLAQIKGSRRLKKFVLPRQILMYLLRHDLRMNLMEIGEFLDGRDHTTIMYGVEKITNLLPKSEDLRVALGAIRKRLYG